MPTAIFPAGTNSDGQPGNLQLEGRPFSDPELLGMAADFERFANGHVETTYAPALRFDPDRVVEPVPATPAPPTQSPAPPPAGTGEGSATPATAPTPPTAKLLGAGLRGGKVALTFSCDSTTAQCSFFVRARTLGASIPPHQVTIGAGATKTVRLGLKKKARRRAAAATTKAKVVVTMVPVSGSAVESKRTVVLAAAGPH